MPNRPESFSARTRWFLLIILGALLLVSCGSSKRGAVPSSMDDLSNLIESRQFEIEHDWAVPQRGRNINLTGIANYIRVEGDSVQLFLPYFGVRHFGGGYGDGGGIEYEGLLQELEIKQEERRMLMTFDAGESSEGYQFHITLYPNGNVNTTVISTQRDNISYRGTVRERVVQEQ